MIDPVNPVHPEHIKHPFYTTSIGRNDFVWDLAVLFDDVLQLITTPKNEFATDLSSWMLNVIDWAHIAPLVLYIIDFCINRIIFPKRQIIMLLFIVILYTCYAWFFQMMQDTYSKPTWATVISPGSVLPTAVGHYYPLYPSSLSFKCSDWSIIYQNDTKVYDDGTKITYQTFTNEKYYPDTCLNIKQMKKQSTDINVLKGLNGNIWCMSAFEYNCPG